MTVRDFLDHVAVGCGSPDRGQHPAILAAVLGVAEATVRRWYGRNSLTHANARHLSTLFAVARRVEVAADLTALVPPHDLAFLDHLLSAA